MFIRRSWVVAGMFLLAGLAQPPLAAADLEIEQAAQVTNTKGGKTQNPTIDRAGKVIVFTANVDMSGGSITDPTQTFDEDGTGNDFASGTPPQPACIGCSLATEGQGNLFLWVRSNKFGQPGNTVRQLTFSTAGGFEANNLPDVNQKGSFVAWDSDDDHVGTNADGNREIFLYDIRTDAISQLTNTLGNGNTANRSANIDDKADLIVFESQSDFSADATCKLSDGTTACGNADGNSEIMVRDRALGTLTQITATTGGAGNASLHPRISSDGRYVAFQSTRDFGVQPGGIASCAQIDGVPGCSNTDGNGEIWLFDREDNALEQITNTANSGSCSGTNPNERVEISKRGKYLTWQSRCEFQLNPTGCGDCDGSDNDEVFLAEVAGKKLVQVTISDSGFNRVPRISGSGRYVVFESNRAYLGANPSHARTLYVLKRVPFRDVNGFTAKVQLEEDAVLAEPQNPDADATTIDFTGGFNSTIEQFGISTNGRFIAFDNSKGVGNQETWFLDKNGRFP